jgi:hypothetical protein
MPRRSLFSPRAALAAVILPVLGVLTPIAVAQSTFTYQGQLASSGSPITGNVLVKFVLYDAPAGGTALATWSGTTQVENGLFTVRPNLGAGQLGTSNRWLEISVSESGLPTGFTTLSPRTPLDATPRAITADRAESSQQAIFGETSSTTVDQAQRVADISVTASPSITQSFITFGGAITQINFASTSPGPVQANFRVYEGEGTLGRVLSDQIITVPGDSPSVPVPLAQTFTPTSFSPYTFAITPVGPGTLSVAAANSNPYPFGSLNNDPSRDMQFEILTQPVHPSTVLRGRSVGIGTSDPTAKLDIRDDITNATNLLNIQSPSTQGTSLTIRNGATGGRPWQLLATGPDNLGGAGNLQITSPGFENFGIVPFTVSRFGTVGISSPIPGRLLELGSFEAPAEALLRLTSKDRFGSAFRTWDVGVPRTEGIVLGSAYSFIIHDTTSARDPVTQPTFMIQYGSGNVGLNTVLPSQRLTIGGNPGIDGIGFPDSTVQYTAYTGLRRTRTADPPSIPAGGVHNLNLLFEEAAPGQIVQATIRESIGGLTIGQVRASSTAVVTVTLHNRTTAAIDLPAITVDMLVIR